MGKLVKRILYRYLQSGARVFMVFDDSQDCPTLIEGEVRVQPRGRFDLVYKDKPAGAKNEMPAWRRNIRLRELILSREDAEANFGRRLALFALEGGRVRVVREGDKLRAERY